MNRRAHAALAPWEGQNALDAAVSAYTSVSMLRQQIKPTHRVHGTIKGKDWTANSEFFVPPLRLELASDCTDHTAVIPDYAQME